MLRISHCLDNRLIDSGKVVSPTHPPHFTPQKHYYFYVSGSLLVSVRGSESASDRLFSAKLLPTFADVEDATWSA
jgi:hypothetical protein